MLLLIDGHNVIGQMPDIHLEDPNDERELVMRLRRYLHRIRKTGLVVFDGGLPGIHANEWSSAKLTVRFAVRPQTADDVMIERIRREKNPRGLIVVSSDHQIQNVARRAGASVKDATTFVQELKAIAVLPSAKEHGLSAAEVETWEATFQHKRKP